VALGGELWGRRTFDDGLIQAVRPAAKQKRFAVTSKSRVFRWGRDASSDMLCEVQKFIFPVGSLQAVAGSAM